MKPNRGTLHYWRKVYFHNSLVPESLGYYVMGYRSEHKRLGTFWQTSAVLKFFPKGVDGHYKIETLNSFYELVGEEYGQPQRSNNQS